MLHVINREGRISRKMLAIAWLGFSSGLPLLLVGSTLQAWFTTAGASLKSIAYLSFVGLPYLYKFIWAPLIDRYAYVPWGRRLSWIRCLQMLMVIALLGMSLLNPHHQPWLMAGIALTLAFMSATQDTAIDAYRIEITSIQERPRASVITNVAYRCAMITAGALALICAHHLGWHITYFAMAILIACLAWLTPLAPKTNQVSERVAVSLRQSVLAPIQSFFKRYHWQALGWVGLMILYKLSEAMTLSLSTPFLLRWCGFDLQTVGAVSKFVGITATLVGSIAASFLMPRLGLYKSLWMFAACQVIAGLGFIALALHPHSLALMTGVVFMDYLFGGLTGVVFVVLLMQLCDQRFTATQYAFFSAVAASPRVLIAPLSAFVVSHYGWVTFYSAAFLLAIPGFMILYSLRVGIRSLANFDVSD